MSKPVIDPQRGPHIRDYSDQSQDRVVIYSNSGWWAAKGCGYTTYQMASVFTRGEAYEMAGHCGPEKGCEFHNIPADHIPTLRAEVVRLREVLEAYDAFFGDKEGEVHPDCTCDNCKTAYRIIEKAKAALAAQPATKKDQQ